MSSNVLLISLKYSSLVLTLLFNTLKYVIKSCNETDVPSKSYITSSPVTVQLPKLLINFFIDLADNSPSSANFFKPSYNSLM